MATEGLRIRSELQRAIEEERYSDAASLRDQLKEVDSKMKGTSALAGEWNVRVEPKFRLGQRVLHSKHQYRGVVVGWDFGCCETKEFAKVRFYYRKDHKKLIINDRNKGRRVYNMDMHTVYAHTCILV